MGKIDILKTMLARDETNALTWFLLGLEYAEQGERKAALHAFTQALTHGDEEIRAKIIREQKHILQETPLLKAIEDSGLYRPFSAAPFFPAKKEDGLFAVGLQEPRSNRAITMADICGMEELKKHVYRKIIHPFFTPGLRGFLRKKGDSGVLLYGPPGCGKSYWAEAIAGECQAQFLPLRKGNTLSPYQGIYEENIKSLFASAREQKRSLLFFDEIDMLDSGRGEPSSLTLRRAVDQLLFEMDKANRGPEKLLVIGATSMPWGLDLTLQRSGHFDRMIFVPPPDEPAREAIFRSLLAGRPVEPLDFSQLAAWTNLYSAADIEYVVELAMEQVLHDLMTRGIERPIRLSDLRESIAATHPSTIEWLRTMKHYVKYGNRDECFHDLVQFLKREKRW